MPLWKVYHPAGAFTAEDKKALAKRGDEGGVLRGIPLPRFYVVFIFEEVAKDSCFVGGEPHNKFVRFKVDQIARTLPGPVIRESWSPGHLTKSLLPSSRTGGMIGKFPLMRHHSTFGHFKVNFPRRLNLSLRSGG